LEGVGLAPSRRRAATWVRSSVWAFLARVPFAAKAPLLSLGFAWILSSESRLFKGLRDLWRERYFLGPAPRGKTHGNGSCGRGRAETQDCSWGKLNLISNFLQEFVVRPLPFGRQSKSNAPEVKTQSPPAAATPSRKQSLERALSTAQLRKKAVVRS
jgi:hypothetical protein